MAPATLLKQTKLVCYHVTLIVEVAERVTANKPVKEHNWAIMTEVENSADTLYKILLRVFLLCGLINQLIIFNVPQKIFFKI